MLSPSKFWKSIGLLKHLTADRDFQVYKKYDIHKMTGSESYGQMKQK